MNLSYSHADQLIAAYMAREFGMKYYQFYTVHKNASESEIKEAYEKSIVWAMESLHNIRVNFYAVSSFVPYRYYLTPESEEILKPKDGDIILGVSKIIYRDSKPFFYPQESEEFIYP